MDKFFFGWALLNLVVSVMNLSNMIWLRKRERELNKRAEADGTP